MVQIHVSKVIGKGKTAVKGAGEQNGGKLLDLRVTLTWKHRFTLAEQAVIDAQEGDAVFQFASVKLMEEGVGPHVGIAKGIEMVYTFSPAPFTNASISLLRERMESCRFSAHRRIP